MQETKQHVSKSSQLVKFIEFLKQRKNTMVLLAAYVTGLGVILGGGVSLYQFSASLVNQREANKIKQLTTFESFKKLVDKGYEREKCATEFVAQNSGKYRKDAARKLIQTLGSGSRVYFSDEFKQFRHLHEFYEELGFQVDQGVLNFDLVFELVTFPSDFYYETAELCSELGENWFPYTPNLPSKRIVGFCDNTRKLATRYELHRECSDKWYGYFICEKPKLFVRWLDEIHKHQ